MGSVAKTLIFTAFWAKQFAENIAMLNIDFRPRPGPRGGSNLVRGCGCDVFGVFILDPAFWVYNQRPKVPAL